MLVYVAGSFAINPATGERVPIWVADYVLGSYGSGAIMAVPAHDTRDHEFAQHYGLPIVRVVQGRGAEAEQHTHPSQVRRCTTCCFHSCRSRCSMTQHSLGSLTV